MDTTLIKQLAESTRKIVGTDTYPVPVEKIAEAMGVDVRYMDYEDDLSGFALQKNGVKIIGINAAHSQNRKRFTLAHEIAHLLLHGDASVNYDLSVPMYRDSHSSDGSDVKEREANRFAAELLMPADSIRDEVNKRGGLGVVDEDSWGELLQDLAETYGVSQQALSIRLAKIFS